MAKYFSWWPATKPNQKYKGNVEHHLYLLLTPFVASSFKQDAALQDRMKAR
jgi:hypothetical protein